jgi:hypothetical protein
MQCEAAEISAPLIRRTQSSKKFRRLISECDNVSESWELSKAHEEIKIVSGALYVLRTGDAVGAVSWGRSKAKAMPCCLGGRQLGVTVLPAGFLYGRHFFVYEFPKEASVVSSSSSLSEASMQTSPRLYSVVSFQFFHEGRRGCLEYLHDSDSVQAVLLPDSTDGLVLEPNQWFHAIPVCSPRVSFKSDEGETALCLLRPQVKPTVCLKWKMFGSVKGAPLDASNSAFVFHLRRRAPHLVTDFLIEPSSFLSRLSNAFENRETDNRDCVVLQRDTTVAEEPLHMIEGSIAATVPTVRQPVLHDFLTSERSRTVRAVAVLLQVITSSTTIVIVIGVGYSGEPPVATGLRYTLYSLIMLSYIAIWIFFNQFYATCMFEFLLRRGHLMDVTPDVVRFKYLFAGGWIWYWIVVAVYLATGGIYLHFFKEVTLGTSWLFFTNSVIFFGGLVYKLRSPFDQQLMPLSTFVKSFDDGIISEDGLRRASAFLKQLQPVQACVSLANPPAYAFLGLLPTRQSCCWNFEGFAKRITVVIICSLLLGGGMIAAVILRQLILGSNPFDAVNACLSTCVTLVDPSDFNVTAQTQFCQRCLCLCVSMLAYPEHLLYDCPTMMNTASICSAPTTCVSKCPL